MTNACNYHLKSIQSHYELFVLINIIVTFATFQQCKKYAPYVYKYIYIEIYVMHWVCFKNKKETELKKENSDILQFQKMLNFSCGVKLFNTHMILVKNIISYFEKLNMIHHVL